MPRVRFPKPTGSGRVISAKTQATSLSAPQAITPFDGKAGSSHSVGSKVPLNAAVRSGGRIGLLCGSGPETQLNRSGEVTGFETWPLRPPRYLLERTTGEQP
jgi:hypothetical protein